VPPRVPAQDSNLLEKAARGGYEPVRFWEEVGAADWNVPRYWSPAHEAQAKEIRRLLRWVEFSSILDVGCGDGRLADLLLLLQPFARYTGVDVSPDALARVQERYPEAELHRSALWDWSAEGRQWDLVVCSEVLMHVPHEHFGPAMELLMGAARKLLIVDWYPSAGKAPAEIAPWCFYHTPQLVELLGEPVVTTGEQGIWLWSP